MAGLRTYHAKRKFGVTAEPKGKIARKRGHAFVIQKHAATRLHYDLRLELDGVMKSWAVTRGPSLVPGEKRLAVEVEDHPVEYNKFEGTIPEGRIRRRHGDDLGPRHLAARGRSAQGIEKGHLTFVLDGEKLHGGWHLVRMHRRRGEKRNNWLLIKQHDDAERSARDKDILEQRPLSVVTGRTHGRDRQRRKPQEARRRKSAQKERRQANAQAAAAAILRATKDVMSAKNKPPRGRAAALPAFVEPALATLADKAPDERQLDPRDQVRRLPHPGAARRTARSSCSPGSGLDWTEKFPTIAEAVAKLPADTALIDGELVVEDDKGVSSFSLLQQDLKAGRHDRMVLLRLRPACISTAATCAPLPLNARKEALARLLANAPKRGPLRLSESLTEPGPVLLKHACKLGLEGIVSKLADAPYRSGRGHEWIKTKCSDRQELVIAGFAPSTADAHAVGALVLGLLRPRQAELCRPHRHRLHARNRARPLPQAQGAETRKIAVRRDAGGRTRRARADLGRTQVGRGS